MPEDLSNPLGMFPHHYDTRYDQGGTTFNSMPSSIKNIVQMWAKNLRGYPFNIKEMNKVLQILDQRNLLQRNPGDPKIIETIKQYLNLKNKSKRIAAKWLT
jgi:hypothetical protein